MTIDDAVQQYSLNFGMQSDQFMGFNRKAFPWSNIVETKDSEQHSADLVEDVKSAFERDLQELPAQKPETPAEPRKRYRFQTTPKSESREEDSDGEEVWLCRMCNLPLGDI